MKDTKDNKRILAIEPCSKGFGFMVFDTPEYVVDWGVTRVWGKGSEPFVARVMTMVERFLPDEIMFPDPAFAKGRSIRKLAAALILVTADRTIPVRLVQQRREIMRTLFPIEASTKYQRAKHLALAFPELQELIPHRRKLWTSQDDRESIFGALTLIVIANGADSDEDAAQRKDL